MSIPCSIKDLELKKFVECPADQPSVSVKVCNPEDIVVGEAGAKTQTIYNVTIATADTEQSLVLPTTICGYIIKTRGSGTLKLTHNSGESGSTFLEIPPKAAFTNEHKFENLTLYFQSPSAGEVVEVVAWS